MVFMHNISGMSGHASSTLVRTVTLGACYVTPDGNHIGLNIRHLAAWAAAMVCYLAYVLHCNADYLSTRLPEKRQNISLPTSLTLMVPMALGLLCRDRVGALALWHKLMPGHPQLQRRKP